MRVSTLRWEKALSLGALLLHSVSAFRVPQPALWRSNSALYTATYDPIKTSEAVSQKDESSDQWILDSLEKEDRCVVGPKEVLVYDTSLRDGTQGESVAATCDDKLKIVRRLHSFDVDFIEAGWPGSNPKDAEFFQRAKEELTAEERTKLVAFGSTRRKSVKASEDPQVQALLDSEAPTICLVAKAHAWQVEEILKATREQNLEMIRDTVSFLRSKGRRVFVDLEHFFDGYKHDKDYVMKCAEVAADAGASCLVLCDTNGGSMPWDVTNICKEVVDYFGGLKTIGIHTHNDCGMAVANSLAGANSGVGLIQGTINGIGERTGNADLCSIVPSLAFHMESKMTCKSNLEDLTKLSRFVDEILNRTPNQGAPYVGSSAFAHKGGLHVAAMERSPLSYQHIQPELVGNQMRVLVSELSGRNNILQKIEEVGMNWGGITAKVTNEKAMAILNRVKALENKGYSFEGADASVHLMILHATQGYCSPFQVRDYNANVYDNNMDKTARMLSWNENKKDLSGNGPTARATVSVRTVNTDPDAEDLYVDMLEVADGNGPVDALANALRRALLPSHPSLEGVELVDYKVRILDPSSATGAATRVMIEFKDTRVGNTWTTVSVDTNVVSASLNALVDGLEYALIENSAMCTLDDDGHYLFESDHSS
ncbi:2-isopropylmalate synthase [Seminavis robusta]|uniref:(R)-citramalate synthase n=1 Tax=Seminavis robusta TaxID=568900 RepID=A0A9N8H0L1_9STRA|nr:2-isopropylmalate synthase [Seminavis robusta]|eukprot:Sro22_g015470.1 2-isopropylmalate synthase (655) ;mRNA; r:131814-134209